MTSRRQWNLLDICVHSGHRKPGGTGGTLAYLVMDGSTARRPPPLHLPFPGISLEIAVGIKAYSTQDPLDRLDPDLDRSIAGKAGRMPPKTMSLQLALHPVILRSHSCILPVDESRALASGSGDVPELGHTQRMPANRWKSWLIWRIYLPAPSRAGNTGAHAVQKPAPHSRAGARQAGAGLRIGDPVQRSSAQTANTL